MSSSGATEKVSGPWSPVPGQGWRSVRGVEGFFRVGQEAGGRWWLLDPEGRPFFCRAVHGVRAAVDSGDGALAQDSGARLRRWGFNALGAGSEAGVREDGLPFFGVVDFFGGEVAPIVAGGARLPDVFDPRWPALARERAAAICASLAGERQMIGWVTDDRVAWAQPSMAGRPTLLQICLSLEPSFPAYHAAWEFALALHGGNFEALVRGWGVKLANKEAVRELTRAEEGLATRGYLRDETRWTREFARRYFSVTAAAIRAADPNHLVLGCRWEGATSAAVMSEGAYPIVDVPLVDWRELPALAAEGRGPAARGEGREGPSAGASAPVLAANVCWTTEEFLKLPVAARVLRLTSVEWMLRRARTALEKLARHPAVVGYAWSAWQDEPGEQPPFARGLVHTSGAEAREHTELLTQFNARAESLRAGAEGALQKNFQQ